MNGKIKCLGCNRALHPKEFYENKNPLFSSDKFEVCKECILGFLGDKDAPGYLIKVKQMLAHLNRPFVARMWVSRKGDWGKYIQYISSLANGYKEATFAQSDETLLSPSNKTEDEQVEEPKELFSEEELKDLIRFWGKGLTHEDYDFLQSEYTQLINAYECDSYAMEILFKSVAHQSLILKRLREEGKPVNNELKTLQDLLGSANIKPSQESGANATEQATFGTLIKKYENERPIPEPDPAWKDVDGIKKYIQVWFLGHLCKMLGISNEYSKMYEDELNKHTVETPEYVEDEGVE